MIHGYKIIGMCLTKVNDEDNTDFTEYLSLEAIKNEIDKNEKDTEEAVKQFSDLVNKQI